MDDPGLEWPKRLSDLIFPFLNSESNYDLEKLRFQKYAYAGLSLSDKMYNTRRVCISTHGVLKINDSIYEQFMADLTSHVDTRRLQKVKSADAIIEFMNIYDIDEDDIRFDSLKKNEYRERVRIAKKIFHTNLPSAGAVLDLSFNQHI